MKHALRVWQGIDPLPALMQLHRAPELWDEFNVRTAGDETPHAGLSDIWLRYRERGELTHKEAFWEPHFAVWWPAWQRLTALRPIVFGMAARCEATHIGGVFLTRIPPGGHVAPHTDLHSWHARFYNTKVYVPLTSNGRCINRAEDEEIVMGVGEGWIWNNLVEHEVRNEGDRERITLIMCFRQEG